MLHYLDVFYNRIEATYPEITSTAAVITHGEKPHSLNLFGARDWHPALFLIVLGNQYDRFPTIISISERRSND